MPTYQYQQAPEDYRGDVRKEYPVLPDGYRTVARVTEIEEVDAPWDKRDADGNPIPGVKDRQLRFKFAFDYQGEPLTLFGNTRPEFYDHPDCKLAVWTKEILGIDELPPGFVLDTDRLIGHEVEIVVSQYEKRNKPGQFGNSVNDIIRTVGNAYQPPASAPAPSYDPAEEPFCS